MQIPSHPATAPGRPVLVGTDGSAAAGLAVRWAAEEAQLRGCTLLIVCALQTAPGGPPLVAHSLLDVAVTIARTAAPDVAIKTRAVIGRPTPVLSRLAPDVQLTVVGHRGSGGRPSIALGSTAATLSRSATGPVAVVRFAPGRPVPDRDRPIVVAVDGTPQSRHVVEAAAQLAERRGAMLHAVYVWPERLPDVLRRLGRGEREPGREASERLLAECLAGLAADHPDLPVRESVVRGHPAWALLELSDSAQLVVLGPHSPGARACGLTLVQAASCPVLVLPVPETSAEPGRCLTTPGGGAGR
ncbi:universal stress protein [Pseudonocardia sp. T1-2H]|uniref:universal stress protein n=1 Tax=Pseudonocardia sp. T1-2H TaxID=3128899 RepID=UPI003101AFBF